MGAVTIGSYAGQAALARRVGSDAALQRSGYLGCWCETTQTTQIARVSIRARYNDPLETFSVKRAVYLDGYHWRQT
jgi:hypothetical protein